MRTHTNKHTRTQEIVIEKGGHDVIFKLHVDPGGYHLLIGGNQVYIHVYVYVCMHVCMYVCMYVCMVYIHVYVCVFIRVWVCMHT